MIEGESKKLENIDIRKNPRHPFLRVSTGVRAALMGVVGVLSAAGGYVVRDMGARQEQQAQQIENDRVQILRMLDDIDERARFLQKNHRILSLRDLHDQNKLCVRKFRLCAELVEQVPPDLHVIHSLHTAMGKIEKVTALVEERLKEEEAK